MSPSSSGPSPAPARSTSTETCSAPTRSSISSISGASTTRAYLGARKQGLGESEAVRRRSSSPPATTCCLSENGLLGMLTTGIRSNADLAANYAGFKFYRNLTEEVRIGNRVMPPMLVRQGPYWRLNDQVRPDSDFFTAFITPHWNEALNPNVYANVTDARVRAVLRSRCPDLLDWYRDERGRPLSRRQFVAIEKELSTFTGRTVRLPERRRKQGQHRHHVFPVRDNPRHQRSVPRRIGGSSRTSRIRTSKRMGARARAQAASPDRRRDRRSINLDARNCGGLQDMDNSRKSNACSRKERTPIRRISTERGRCMPQPAGGRSTWSRSCSRMAPILGAKALYGMTPLRVAVEQAQLGTRPCAVEPQSGCECPRPVWQISVA